jgi:hypothetical protein
MITSQELRDVLIKAGVREHVIGIFDEEFVMPTADWMEHELADALTNFLFENRIVYRENAFDCNRFSKFSSTVVDLCWARMREGRDAAMAVGLFAYGSFFARHCMIVALHRNQDNTIRVSFYEPQPSYPEGSTAFTKVCMRPRKLDAQDIASCFCCLFI